MGLREELVEALQKALEERSWNTAIGVLERLSELDPANPHYRQKVGDCYVELNVPAAAIAEYRRAAQVYARGGSALKAMKAMALYKRILRLDPQDFMAKQALFGIRPVVTTPWAKNEISRITTKEALVFPLFAPLTQEQFNEVVDRLRPPRLFPAGATIIREGEFTQDLYIIIRGRVQVSTQKDGQEVKLAELGENEFFGEIAALMGGPRTASVAAIEETEVLVLQGQDIIEITKLFPVVKEILVDYSQRRMRHTLDVVKGGEPPHPTRLASAPAPAAPAASPLAPAPKERLRKNLADCVEAKDWARAIAILEELLTLEPMNPQHRLRLGDYHVKLNNRVRAIEEYYRAVEAFTHFGEAVKANAVCKMILRLDPTAEKALRLTKAATPPQHGASRVQAILARSLFASVSHELVKRAQPLQTYPPGTALIREGEKSDTLYIIIAGLVEVRTRLQEKDLRVAVLGEAEFFWELSSLTGRPRTASVATVAETEVLIVDGPDVVELMARHPSLKKTIVEYGLRWAAETADALKRHA